MIESYTDRVMKKDKTGVAMTGFPKKNATDPGIKG